MGRKLFILMLKRLVDRGVLTLIDTQGAHHVVAGEQPGNRVAVRINDPSVYWRVLRNPSLAFGEVYMDGSVTLEQGTLYEFIELLVENHNNILDHPAMRLAKHLTVINRQLNRHNPVGKARKNAAHHYDLDDGLYDLFLDSDKQYSCAYYTRPDLTLEQAQQAKKIHLASKLDLKPDMSVLDIGCGWGGLALFLARETGVRVVGVTLSERQHAIARRRVQETGLEGQVDIRLMDYREIDESFDRIVSVGMFEHVGANHYEEFFSRMRQLLHDNGVALLHSIGRMEPPQFTNAWIEKYIFPGGYIPAVSETFAAIEKSGLYATDVEILRLHYANTLREWRNRFAANRDRAALIYDEAFCRMWEVYLSTSECSFRYGGLMNFQIQLAKNQEALPVTRDYMMMAEHNLTMAQENNASAGSQIRRV